MTYFLRIALSLVALSALALALVCSTGCGGDGLPRAPIAGQVTIGGQPLASGRILFMPLAPNEGPTVSAPIVAGEYALSRTQGPIAGQNRVEVEANLDLGFAIDDEAAFARRGGRPLPPNPVPAEFNRNSKLTVEVKPGEENTYNVTIPAAAQTASAYR
jgi:hypothetical protein